MAKNKSNRRDRQQARNLSENPGFLDDLFDRSGSTPAGSPSIEDGYVPSFPTTLNSDAYGKGWAGPVDPMLPRPGRTFMPDSEPYQPDFGGPNSHSTFMPRTPSPTSQLNQLHQNEYLANTLANNLSVDSNTGYDPTPPPEQRGLIMNVQTGTPATTDFTQYGASQSANRKLQAAGVTNIGQFKQIVNGGGADILAASLGYKTSKALDPIVQAVNRSIAPDPSNPIPMIPDRKFQKYAVAHSIAVPANNSPFAQESLRMHEMGLDPSNTGYRLPHPMDRTTEGDELDRGDYMRRDWFNQNVPVNPVTTTLPTMHKSSGVEWVNPLDSSIDGKSIQDIINKSLKGFSGPNTTASLTDTKTDAYGRPIARIKYETEDPERGTQTRFTDISAARVTGSDTPVIFVGNSANPAQAVPVTQTITGLSVDQKSNDITGYDMRSRAASLSAALRTGNPTKMLAGSSAEEPNGEEDYAGIWTNVTRLTAPLLTKLGTTIVRPEKRSYFDKNGNETRGNVQPNDVNQVMAIMNAEKEAAGEHGRIGTRNNERNLFDLLAVAEASVPQNERGEAVGVSSQKDIQFRGVRGTNQVRTDTFNLAPTASSKFDIQGIKEDFSDRPNMRVGFYEDMWGFPDGVIYGRQGAFQVADQFSEFVPGKRPEEMSLAPGQVYNFNGSTTPAIAEGDEYQGQVSEIPGLPGFDVGNKHAARIDRMVYDEEMGGTHVMGVSLTPSDEAEIKTAGGFKGMIQPVRDGNPLMTPDIDLAAAIPADKRFVAVAQAAYQNEVNPQDVLRDMHAYAQNNNLDLANMVEIVQGENGGSRLNILPGGVDAMSSLAVKWANSKREVVNVNDMPVSSWKHGEMVKLEDQRRSGVYQSTVQTLTAGGMSQSEAEFEAGTRVETDTALTSQWQIFQRDEEGNRKSQFVKIDEDSAGKDRGYFTASYKTARRVLNVPTQMYSKFGGKEVNFSPEDLDVIAETQPEMFQSIQKMSENGSLRNPGLDIMLSTRANYSGGNAEVAQRVKANMKTLDVENPEFLQAYTAATTAARDELGADATSDQVRRNALRDLSQDERFAGKNITSGNDTLTTLDTAANYYTLRESGTSVFNYGSSMVNMIEAANNKRIATEHGDVTDEHQAALAGATGEATYEMAKTASLSATVRKAIGVALPSLGTSARASFLPAGIMAVDRRDVQAQLSRMSDTQASDSARALMGEGPLQQDPRRDIMSAFEQGKVTGSSIMWPGANQANFIQSAKVMLTDAVRKLPGADWIANTHRGVMISDVQVAGHTKDSDGDDMRAFLNMFSIQPVRSQEEMISRATNLPGSELISQVEKFAKVNEGTYKNLETPAGQRAAKAAMSMQKLMGMYENEAASKSEMGLSYNSMVRTLGGSARRLMDKIGLGRGAEREQVYSTSSNLGQSVYQQALDLKYSKDPGQRDYRNITQSAIYDSDVNQGRHKFSPLLQGKSLGATNAQEFANVIASKVTRFGQMNQPDDPEGSAEMFEAHIGDIARSIAPVRDIDNEERIGKIQDFLRYTRDNPELSASEFETGFQESVGQDTYTWLYGKKGAAAEDRSILGFSTNREIGANQLRWDTKKKSQRHLTPDSLPGNMYEEGQQALADREVAATRKNALTGGIEGVTRAAAGLTGGAFQGHEWIAQRLGGASDVQSNNVTEITAAMRPPAIVDAQTQPASDVVAQPQVAAAEPIIDPDDPRLADAWNKSEDEFNDLINGNSPVTSAAAGGKPPIKPPATAVASPAAPDPRGQSRPSSGGQQVGVGNIKVINNIEFGGGAVDAGTYEKTLRAHTRLSQAAEALENGASASDLDANQILKDQRLVSQVYQKQSGRARDLAAYDRGDREKDPGRTGVDTRFQQDFGGAKSNVVDNLLETVLPKHMGALLEAQENQQAEARAGRPLSSSDQRKINDSIGMLTSAPIQEFSQFLEGATEVDRGDLKKARGFSRAFTNLERAQAHLTRRNDRVGLTDEETAMLTGVNATLDQHRESIGNIQSVVNRSSMGDMNVTGQPDPGRSMPLTSKDLASMDAAMSSLNGRGDLADTALRLSAAGELSPEQKTQAAGISRAYTDLEQVERKMLRVKRQQGGTLSDEDQAKLDQVSGTLSQHSEAAGQIQQVLKGVAYGDVSVQKPQAQGREIKAPTETETSRAEVAVRNLTDLNEVMTHLSASTKGFTEIQKTHLEQINNLGKAYKDMEATGAKLGDMSKNGQPLTSEQSDLHKAITDVLGKTEGSGKDLKALQAMGRYGMLNVEQPGMSDEEHTAMMMSALSRGGAGGRRARSRLSGEDYSRFAQDNIPGPLRELLGDEGASNAASAVMRVTSHLQGGLWAMTHIKSNIVQPMEDAANFYTQRASAREMTLLQSGAISYDDMMAGQSGVIRRRTSQQSVMQEELGRQIYNSYAGVLNTNGGDTMGRTAGGIASIAAPALGAAVLGNQFSSIGGPMLGSFLGAGAAVLAGVNYFTQSTQDIKGLSSTIGGLMANTKGLESPGARNGDGLFFGGAIETAIKDPMGAASLALAGVFNRQGVLDATKQAALDFSSGQVVQGLGGHDQDQGFGAYRDQARSLGYSRGDVESSLVQQYVKTQADQGVSQDEALSLYSFHEIYAPKSNISSGMFKKIQELQVAGITHLPEDAIAGAVAMGGAGLDQNAVTHETERLADYYGFRQSQGANMPLEREYVSQAQQRAGSINQDLRMANMQTVDYLDPGAMGRQYQNDPLRQGLFDQIYHAMAGTAQVSQVYANATNPAYNAVQNGNLAAGDLLSYSQYQTQNQGMAQYTASKVGYGNMSQQSIDYLSSVAMQTGVAGQQNYARVQGILGGDKELITQAALSGQLPSQFATMDLQTGAGAFDYGISKTEYGNIADYAKQHDLGGLLSYDEMKKGTVGMQEDLRLAGIQNRDYNFQMQQTQAQMQYQMTTGGASVNSQGFSVGGNGLAGYQALAASVGQTFNPGNGMTIWQVQDAQTNLSRQQQTFGLQQQGQSLALNQQQFNLSGQQFEQQWNLNYQQFQYNTNYQRGMMQFQRGQQVTQEGWQQQDLNYSRNVNELNFGWQMEDYDRNIRYARGREKVDLMRQQSRAVISFSMQEGQADKQQERFDQQKKWSEELFNKEKANFEQQTKFKEQEMQQQKKFFDQNRELEAQRLQMAQQAYQKQLQWTREEWALEDQSRNLDRQSYSIQFALQQQIAQQNYAYQVQVQKTGDAIGLANNAMSSFIAWLNQVINDGKIVQSLANSSTTSTTTTQAAGTTTGSGIGNNGGGYKDGGYVDIQALRRFDFGGFTGGGPLDMAAGLVHGGEYVIPHQGVPVVHGDNPITVDMLRKILDQLVKIHGLGPGRVNANITVPAGTTFNSSELTTYERASARRP